MSVHGPGLVLRCIPYFLVEQLLNDSENDNNDESSTESYPQLLVLCSIFFNVAPILHTIDVVCIKGMFLYSAISSTWDCSRPFTLHPLAHLFIPLSLFSGKHSATLQLLCEDYPFTYPPLSVARYSFA